MTLHRAGDEKGAIELYSRSFILDPSVPGIMINLGVALRASGRPEAACICYRRALAREESPALHSNLGNALRQLGRFDEALEHHKKAIELDKGFADGHYNYGLLRFDQGHPEEALECYKRALALDPANTKIYWDRALALLLTGDLVPGFREYEWRWSQTALKPRGYSRPQWDGGDLEGKTLLIHSEQGFGDFIQFARFLPEAAARSGARLMVECPRDLVRLVAAMECVHGVIPKGDGLPEFDAWIPIMSLPRVLGTTWESLPAETPYLDAPPDAGFPLGPNDEKSLRVAIAWAGKPSHKNDRMRSIPFQTFMTLSEIPGVALYGFQKGERARDVTRFACMGLVQDLSGALDDFADTAALVRQMDLVVSVDTALVHLAGALGVSAWVLLPVNRDWRWLLGREDTPWYPSVRLFRQEDPLGWEPVMRRIAAELEGLTRDKSGGKRLP